jgi:hypothetical protein
MTIWQLYKGVSPIVATAIHDGHELRPDVAALMKLSDAERLREEDPFTGEWTRVTDNRLIGTHSRFEVDLNRPREKAVYIQPEDAWGLHVWTKTPPDDVIEASLAHYDAFYAEARQFFSELEQKFGTFVVLDLHTYNHWREGSSGPLADPELNPEVNIGTGTMQRERWAPIVERFIHDLREVDFMGRRLDVRENVKFRGGQFPRWTHTHFPESACVLSVEFKKFFMDEWTGIPDTEQLDAIQRSLEATLPGLLSALKT